jgi:DNA polymerase-3 subunit beta
MRVVISQELLAGTLSAVGKAVSTRTINPVLSYVHIIAEPDSLTFTATDGDFTIRRQVAVSGAEPGRILAPARLLADLIARLPKKEVTLAAANNQLNVSSGRSNYDLTTLSDENFPELPSFEGKRLATLSCALLKRGLQQTVFSAVKESSTGGVHYTNGVLFSFKRQDGVTSEGAERDLLLPARVADELEKMLPDDEDAAVELFHESNQVFFRFGNQLVASALLDVRFPDYERVIPKDINSRVQVQRDEVTDALGRVLLVCRQKDQNPIGRVETNETTMTISSDAGEIGRGSEELAAEIAGPQIRMAINPQFLIDALKHLSGDQVTVNWITEVTPIMITSPREPDFTYIVMPIRLD